MGNLQEECVGTGEDIKIEKSVLAGRTFEVLEFTWFALDLLLHWWLRWWRICLQCKRPRFWVSLGWEDPLEKGIATPPVQYSCLENSMNRGACQVTAHGVAKSRTQLKRLTLFLHWIFFNYKIFNINSALPGLNFLTCIMRIIEPNK